MRKSLLWITGTWETIRGLPICRRCPRCGKDGIEARPLLPPLGPSSSSSSPSSFRQPPPPPPLQALVFVSRNPGIPRVFPTRKRKVTMSLRKGTTSTWYHTWFLCSYIRESWAYQASFPRYSAQNDRFATVLENREHTLIHEKKNKKSLRLWKWKYRVCFSINIYIYRWYEFFPSLKNKEPCINYRYSEFRFWKF